MPTYIRPASVTVRTASLGDLFGELVMALVPVAAAAAILFAIAWFAVTYAVVLGTGLVLTCAVVYAEVWVLHRYCTKLCWRTGVRPARPVAARATVTRLSAADRQVLEDVRELLALAAMPDTAPVQVPSYVITDAVLQPRKELP